MTFYFFVNNIKAGHYKCENEERKYQRNKKKQWKRNGTGVKVFNQITEWKKKKTMNLSEQGYSR